MRIFLFVLAIFISTFLFGQTEKGSFIFNLNGDLTHYDFSSIFNGDDNVFAGGLEIKTGYAFINNCFIGLKYRPSYSINFSDKSTFNIFSYGIFSRYYIPGNNTMFYLQTDLNHHHDFSSYFRQNIWNIGAGISHFLSKNVALEGHLNYNFYNRTTITNSFPGIPGDPIIASSNEPTGFDFSMGLNFFLPVNRIKKSKLEREALASRYLKKENKSIGISGTIDFDRKTIQGIIEKSTFKTDKRRRQHRLFSRLDFDNGFEIAGIHVYTFSQEYFLPLSGHFYFNPLIGIGPTINFYDNLSELNLGWNGNAQIGLIHFFNNANLSYGLALNSFDYFIVSRDLNFVSTIYLSSEIFISDKLAVKPSAYYNLSEQDAFLFFYENQQYVSFDKFRLQFGMSYFY